MTDLAFPDPSPALRRPTWGAGASVGLHVAFVAAALWVSPLRQLVVPAPRPIAVEIVTPQELSALEHPAPPAPSAATTSQGEQVAPPLAAPPVAAASGAAAQPGERLAPSGPIVPKLPAGRTITATQFYAGTMLKRPDMQRIRRTLTTLAGSERMAQVCNIEALEQIRRGAPQYAPDTLVAYAMSDPLWNGLTLSAAGGAFRSRRKWYEIAFHCTVAAGYEAVTAFDFTIGAPIPEAKWEEHNLNAEDSAE